MFNRVLTMLAVLCACCLMTTQSFAQFADLSQGNKRVDVSYIVPPEGEVVLSILAVTPVKQGLFDGGAGLYVTDDSLRARIEVGGQFVSGSWGNAGAVGFLEGQDNSRTFTKSGVRSGQVGGFFRYAYVPEVPRWNLEIGAGPYFEGLTTGENISPEHKRILDDTKLENLGFLGYASLSIQNVLGADASVLARVLQRNGEDGGKSRQQLILEPRLAYLLNDAGTVTMVVQGYFERDSLGLLDTNLKDGLDKFSRALSITFSFQH